MKHIPLTEEEREILQLELINSKASYLSEKKKSDFMIIGGLGVGLIISFLMGYSDLSLKISFLPFFIAFNGIVRSVFWNTAAQRGIANLEDDLAKNTKLVGTSAIKLIKRAAKKFVLEDGTAIEQYEVPFDNLKIGDLLNYHRTPKDGYCLKCEVISPVGHLYTVV